MLEHHGTLLDKLDQTIRLPLWIACALAGLALDELSMWRLRREIKRRYG